MSVFPSTNWFIFECIDNSDFEHRLTIGQEYYGSTYTSDKTGKKLILIREDDMGKEAVWNAERFIEV